MLVMSCLLMESSKGTVKAIQSQRCLILNYGVSAFKRSVFESYSLGAPIDLSDICGDLSARGSLAGYEVHERFYEIGSLGGIDDFREYIGRHRNDI